MNTTYNNNLAKSKERHIILDSLRGLALLGVCLANYSEFSLYSFLPEETKAAIPTAGIDTVLRYIQYFFIDGKFYTIFSLLFGIGFSIMLSDSTQNNRNGLTIFYRRMIILFFIGLFHLIFLWAGDILILYAFVGFFFPFFRNVSNKKLLIFSAIFIFLPVLMDACIVLFGWNMAVPVINATEYFHAQAGITEQNFPVWLAENKSYIDVLKFNVAGSFIRLQEFIEGHRVFKVLGLFLLGLYIGRNKLYAKLQNNKALLKKVMKFGSAIGFPASLLYAWSTMNNYLLGLVTHSLIYAISVVPLALTYISAISLFYLKNKENKIFRIFAAPGRMALTNYLMQSVFGMIIFYGIGFELGAKTGLVYVELIAAVVFTFQIIYSYLWLRYFQYGPLEWGWRMLTYGKVLKIKKE